MFNVFQQPWTLLITAIVAWLILLFIHGDSRLWWQTHLVIFLGVAIIAVDVLVEVGLLKFSTKLTMIIHGVLALAIAVLLILQIIHVIGTYERHRWQWFIPIILALAGLGLDFLVKTDLEKINILIRTVRIATEEEDIDAIGAILSEDYSDSYHNSKAALVNHCRRLLSEPLVRTSKEIGVIREITPPRAKVILTSVIHFDEQSWVSREYRSFVWLKIKLDLQKEEDKRWLVNRAEILEVDKQPVNWSYVR